MQCPSCSRTNDESHAFCSQCGEKLARVCAACAFENPAASRFCGGCGKQLESASAPVKAASPERRQMTVMFCDLVGSTELSAQVDPEELSELYKVYRGIAEETITAYDGYVAEYLGDGIVAYFGYPVALENAAERGVRAALATIEAMSRAHVPQDFDDELSVRIGVATGLVVAGDLLGTSDVSQVRTVVGETPNLAARLQSVAAPDTVVISESTRKLLGNVFDLEALEPLALKGIQGMVTPYLVHNEAAGDTLLAASQRDHPLVGRAEELAMLRENWGSVEQGHGSAVLISAEPGLGKSRLVRAFGESLSDTEHTWLDLRASNIHRNTALYPVAELLRRSFEFPDIGEDPAALERLEEGLLTAGWARAETMPLFCDLLAVPFTGEDATIGLSAEARRRRMLETLTDWVFRLSEQQPVILVAEDLHWIDPSTMELLSLLVARCQEARLLVVATSRPEYQPEWLDLPQNTAVALEPLKDSEVAEFVTELTGGAALPKDVLDQVTSKTDGVPLFIEELAKSVLESDLLRRDHGRFERADPLPEFAIPSTLQDSLMARLDRLGSAKELAQRASVIGREFSYPIIAAVSDLPPNSLDRELATLVEAQLVFQVGSPPRSSYTFKHALIQDTAYQSLLRRRRQTMHSELADVLTDQFSEIAEREPEVLAQHYAQAGRFEGAITSFLRAADSAKGQSAQVEAVNHLRNGLETLAQIPESNDRDRLELKLQVALQGPLIATSGYANPEVEQVCARARELCNTVGGGPDLPVAIYGLTTFYLNSCDLVACREVGEALLELSRTAENELHRPAALLQLGFVNYFSGHLEDSLANLKQNMACYEVSKHAPLCSIYGQDPGATAYAQAAVVAWQLGQADRGLEYGHRGVELARTIDDPFTIAATQSFLAYTYAHRRERSEARRVAEELITLCETQNFPQWLNQARVVRGWSMADGSASTAEGLAEIQAGLDELAKVSMVVGGPYFMLMLIEALMAAGAMEPAAGTLEMAIGLAAAKGNHWMDAELFRTKADLILITDADRSEEARTLLDQSAVYARQTHSRIHEARTLCTAHSHGLSIDPDHRRLAVLADELSEGLNTRDMRDIQNVLASH